MNIRKAQVSDAGTLSRFAERCFRETFSAQNSVEDMEEYCFRNFSDDIQKEEIINEDVVTLLLEINGKLAAYSQLYTETVPACLSSKRAGEIRRFYVDASQQGKGVAQHLMSACLSFMKNSGAEAAWLAVWEENAKAIAFYQKFAFTQIGEQSFLLGDDLQRDVIMACQL